MNNTDNNNTSFRVEEEPLLKYIGDTLHRIREYDEKTLPALMEISLALQKICAKYNIKGLHSVGHPLLSLTPVK